MIYIINNIFKRFQKIIDIICLHKIYIHIISSKRFVSTKVAVQDDQDLCFTTPAVAKEHRLVDLESLTSTRIDLGKPQRENSAMATPYN